LTTTVKQLEAELAALRARRGEEIPRQADTKLLIGFREGLKQIGAGLTKGKQLVAASKLKVRRDGKLLKFTPADLQEYVASLPLASRIFRHARHESGQSQRLRGIRFWLRPDLTRRRAASGTICSCSTRRPAFANTPTAGATPPSPAWRSVLSSLPTRADKDRHRETEDVNDPARAAQMLMAKSPNPQSRASG
jgi:hypothetical protein